MPITHAQALPEAGQPAVPGEPVNIQQLPASDWNANHTVTGGLSTAGDITPAADSTDDLGSAALAWAEVYADKIITDRIDEGNAAAGVAFGHEPVPVTTSATDIGSSSKVWQHAYVEGVQFPATQVASADVNNLDDYEEGTWTPVITFATPGDLSVAYAGQDGQYTKVGRQVTVAVDVETSTFTHTTASGQFRITGLPFTVGSIDFYGACEAEGWTLATADYVSLNANDTTTYLRLVASVSGSTAVFLDESHLASGGTVIVKGTLTYWV